MTYGRHEAVLDFCALHSASTATLDILERAEDGADAVGRLYAAGAVQTAHDALEGCLSLGCTLHRSHDTLAVLRLLLDEEEEADAELSAEPGLTVAEAWCWVAWMLSSEARELEYAYPPAKRDDEAAAELERQSDACHERAKSLDQSEGLWRRALDKWDGVQS